MASGERRTGIRARFAGRPGSSSATMGRAGAHESRARSQRADASRRYLDRLYEISTLLTRFNGAERAVPALLEVAARAVALRSAALIADGRDDVEIVTWTARGVGVHDVRETLAAATRFRDYFAGPTSGRPMSQTGPETRRNALALPLVNEAREIFGTLYFECQGNLSEEDLAFLSAVIGQVAIALDRYNAWRHEISMRTRAAFLADASRRLAATLELDATLRTLAAIVVPFIGDYCLLDMLDEHGRLSSGAAAHADPAIEPALRTARARYELREGDPVARALRSGQPQLGPAFDTAQSTRADTHADLCRTMNTVSLLVVPIIARDRTLGTISLGTAASGRRFVQADVTLIEALASAAALAIDNARLYEAARRAVRAREGVVAIVSHDLKNPLGVILLYVSMLCKDLPEGSESRRNAEALGRAAQRMKRLISDLLDAERAEGKRFEVTAHAWPVSQLLGEAIEMFRPLAEKQGVQLTLEDRTGAQRVWCDRERILQVFSNLLGNAMKFTAPGGTITVRAELADAAVRFVVADSGSGISPDRLPYIFERYWRGETRGGTEGVGLGLYIVKAIVAAHRGSITAESTVDVGTRIAFTLPCASGGE